MMGARIVNRRPVLLPLRNVEGSAEYQRAYEKSALAIREFKEAQQLYRARRIGNAEFLRARAAYDKAMAEYDAAYAAEQERASNPPEESLQEKSWREWQENFVRVSADPESASITDLMRAIGYLDKVRSSIQRHAWEQGKKVDANVLAGYENEEQYYQRLIEQKHGRRRNAPRVTQRDVNYAAASYHNLLMQYGENNMATQRAEWKYRDLQRAYAEQQTKRKANPDEVIAGPGRYSVKIFPRMGGDYFSEIRTPDGRYVDTHGLSGPDSVKSWIEKYVYQGQHGPYDVLPALVWKPNKRHWGQYSTSFTVKR